VPYSQINASIRNITRLGGTVSRVQVVGANTAGVGHGTGETSSASAETPSVAKAKASPRKSAPAKPRRGRRGKSGR